METTIYELIHSHSEGKGEGIMWDSVKAISDAVETSMPKAAANRLKKDIYAMMCGGHFNEYFAKDAVSKMYYEDENGEARYAPYWTEATVRELYESHKSEVEGYNFWDFFVALHFVASNNHALIMRWFPDESSDDREGRYVEMTINYLCDADWPTKTKVWDNLNPAK